MTWPLRSSDAERLERSEDFALEPVPEGTVRPGVSGLFGILLGIPTALVFFSVGGVLEYTYGTVALVTGLVVASLLIGVAGWVLTSYASRSGLDSDLMSIRAGFGTAGSAVTSLVYSANFVVLFALEDGIVASAVHARYPGIPKEVVLLTIGVVVMALAWRGVTGLSTAMVFSLPVFGVLMLVAVFKAGERSSSGSFWTFVPAGAHVDATAWLLVLAALLAFIVNATVAADVGRFLPPPRRRVGAALFGGVLQLACFGGATLLGAWFAYQFRGEADPGAYLVALLGGWGVICVLVSQLRINMINAYSGSLSLSNFGARGLGVRPGRLFWMLVLVALGTALAFSDVYVHVLGVLTFEAVFVMAWVATLVSYVVVHDLEHRTDVRSGFAGAPTANPVGLGALTLSLAIATPLAFGAAGALGKGLAPLVAATVAPLAVVVGSWAMRRDRAVRTHVRT